MEVKRIDKLNQKGMTLIEVIVAMAILAVVIVPTLRIFASTSGTNLRSRQRQRATSVAEGVMESFKAYNMEALCRQFVSGTFGGVVSDATTTMNVFAGYNSGGTPTEISPLRDDFTLRDDADYYRFHIANAASEGQLYDVDIMATPAIAPDVLKMDNANEYSDAIICLEEDSAYTARDELENLAKTALETNMAASNPTVDNVEIYNFKRVIDVTVDDNGTTQKVTMKVTCTASATVNYTAGGISGTASYDDSLLKYECILDPTTLDTEVTYYDNTGTIGGLQAGGVKRCKLNQIYLYYFPVYASAFGTGAKDEINIKGTLTDLYNPGSGVSDPKAYGYEPLKIIVAKQLSTRVSGVDLNNSEVTYDVDVSGALSGGGETEFRSNLQVALTPGGSVPSVPTISGFTSSGKMDEEVMERVPLLYNVEIHVFEAGKLEEVATFIGTMNE